MAARASLLPRRFGVDAIILFYDITTLPVAMGLPFSLQPGRGPVPQSAVRTMADVQRLHARPDPETFGHIRELLKRVITELRGELPVIVFAGAPFTLATYCIGTGKDLDATLRFTKEHPDVWHALLERLSTATVHFLSTLVADGASVYQLFDSWAGNLDAANYQRWGQTYHQHIFKSVTGVPRILFVKECRYLDEMTESGADVISLGTRHELAAARQRYPNLVFQGNVDEKLLRDSTPEEVAEATRRCLAAGGGHRHIVNLSHGCDRDMPVENFEAFVRAAKASAD